MLSFSWNHGETSGPCHPASYIYINYIYRCKKCVALFKLHYSWDKWSLGKTMVKCQRISFPFAFSTRFYPQIIRQLSILLFRSEWPFWTLNKICAKINSSKPKISPLEFWPLGIHFTLRFRWWFDQNVTLS